MVLSLREEKRKTGIDILGEAPWGTHICLFYDTRSDLIDSLVTYYKEGLTNNEFCVWVTADPLSVVDAKNAMRQAVPDFDERLKQGQMEIFHYDEWYTKGGSFNIRRTLDAWIDKHDRALAAGYDGSRVSGNTTWIEEGDWRSFVDYEEEINRVIGQYKMIVLCTYSLDKCMAKAVMDVIRCHQYALIKQGGVWDLVQSSGQKLMDDSLRRIEWLIRKIARSEPVEGKVCASPARQNLLALNKCRRILDSVGEEMLIDIVREHLALLETSAVIHEKNGDYAMSIVASNWCRRLNAISRGGSSLEEQERALTGERWLCHSSCWNDASLECIRKGTPVDVKCNGGIRIYAVPIYVEDEIAGAASFGYGDPPKDPRKLEEIASRYGVNRAELSSLAHSYESRPPYVIEVAKNRLKSSARLIGEITRRTEAEKRIAQQNSRLEYLNRELETFSYSVSHDLRAPLRGIDGFSLALLEEYGEKLDEKGKNYLQLVRGEIQHMGQLIDDLLSLSRVSRSELRSEEVNLSSLAESIAKSLKKSEPHRNVEMRCQPDISVRGDAVLLRTVMENLLGNSWKFTSREAAAWVQFGKITAGELTMGVKTAEMDAETPIYFVKDNGAGFDMKYSEKLFTSFGRLHSAHEFPGNGIGLVTVSRIIHRHGGKVWAMGEVGEGAVFYFTLAGEEY